jgi:IclR helix-turn-helix domain
VLTPLLENQSAAPPEPTDRMPELAHQTGLSRNTAHRYLQAGTFPEQRVRPKRRCLLDPYLPYLRERGGARCQNAAQLALELQDRGYQESPTTLRALMRGLAGGFTLVCSSHQWPQAHHPCTQHTPPLVSASVFSVCQTAGSASLNPTTLP